jgi:predicted ATP-grasp superfamily ATP-dependent carboligase
MNVLVLTDDQPMAVQVILCLKKRHVRVTVVGTRRCVELQTPTLCDRFILVESDLLAASRESMVDLLNETCLFFRIDAVLPAGTLATEALIHLSNLLNCARCIPLPDLSTFHLLNDKASFWKVLEAHSLPHPRTSIVCAIEDLSWSQFTGPTVFKPTTGEGGNGVHVAATPGEWYDVCEVLRKSGTFPVLAQEYIPGSDIDFSLVAIDGQVIYWTVQQPVRPLVLRFTTNEEVIKIGSQIVSETNFTGVAHIDMRFDERDGSIRVIEYNPRFWYSVAASAAVGVNFPYIAACLAIGKPVPPVQYSESEISQVTNSAYSPGAF